MMFFENDNDFRMLCRRALPPRPIQTISLREIHQTGLNCAGGFKHTFSVSFKGESGREESDWMIQKDETADQRLRFLVMFA